MVYLCWMGRFALEQFDGAYNCDGTDRLFWCNYLPLRFKTVMSENSDRSVAVRYS